MGGPLIRPGEEGGQVVLRGPLQLLPILLTDSQARIMGKSHGRIRPNQTEIVPRGFEKGFAGLRGRMGG